MIIFDREETRWVSYDVTIDEFMLEHYAEAAHDPEGGTLLIYVRNLRISGYITYVFDVPMIEGLDPDNKDDVKRMIIEGYEND